MHTRISLDSIKSEIHEPKTKNFSEICFSEIKACIFDDKDPQKKTIFFHTISLTRSGSILQCYAKILLSKGAFLPWCSLAPSCI